MALGRWRRCLPGQASQPALRLAGTRVSAHTRASAVLRPPARLHTGARRRAQCIDSNPFFFAFPE